MIESGVTIPDPVFDAQVLIAQGRTAEAAALLRDAIDEGRGGLMARLALGRAWLAAGNGAAALEALREAVSLAPGLPDAAVALGEALAHEGHLPTAIAEFQRALRLDPQSQDARFQLGAAWLTAGETARALAEFAALEPGPARAAEKIAEARRLQAENRAPAGYVRHLFDQFAPGYDARMLEQLSYRGHVLLRELADLLVLPALRGLAVLDLGCGTGLAGTVFKKFALGGRLDGVDLSPGMIARARERELYDSLAIEDIEHFLASPGPGYDMIVAADSLVYLGDLMATIAGCAARLSPGGLLLFTVERAAGEGYELGTKRRYRHGESYLRGLAHEAKLDVAGLLVCSPRCEAKEPVEGLAVALKKPA